MKKAIEALEEWLKDRPQSIKDTARSSPPWNRYRLTKTGQHGTIRSYSEDGTVSMEFYGHDSPDLAAINEMTHVVVFGIDPADLEPLGVSEV